MDPQRGNVLTCSTCFKTFSTKEGLKYHMFTHDVDAKMKCKLCGKISKNPKTLSSHMRMLHTNRDRPSCDICHRVFFASETLRRHVATQHTTLERPRFPCSFPGCGKTYLLKGDVSIHVKIEHSENPTRFPCTLCGKEFKIRKTLETHISTHTTEKAYVCSTCGRSFGQLTVMKCHETIHLEKSTRRIFKCELCPQTFLGRAILQRHVQFVHERQRNHPCTFCDKRFSTSDNMRRHVEARHPSTKEKIHSCDKCKYMSHSKLYLARHARRHNPAIRLECYFCKKQFIRFSELVTHCRRHTLE
ncbi:zinc finger protein 525 [Folsomia candida]|uniref:Zinc finger protein 26 n=1 Tax=Folsomia candida TaxID=158441 RepID=A0A226D617_FOLCA|nr:zinc finger protein 525 [Folsomia candida]XP_021965636.1 zinc finger protein 525 [Folsomia candida]OXA40187.1 Zinc finger protein 26 [Folsomia candida]